MQASKLKADCLSLDFMGDERSGNDPRGNPMEVFMSAMTKSGSSRRGARAAMKKRAARCEPCSRKSGVRRWLDWALVLIRLGFWLESLLKYLGYTE